MKEDFKVIKELAGLRIEEIFDALGIEYREKYHSLAGPCPVHGGNRKDAFSWHCERGIWTCFSRFCHQKHGSDIFGLVRAMRSCTFLQSVRWVKQFVDLNISPDEMRKIRDTRSNKDFIISSRRKTSQATTYPRDSWKKLSWHDYLVGQRGYPTKLIEHYHIGACLEPRRYMSNRVVIPVINADDEIVGFTGRTLDPDWKDKGIPKWKHSLGSWIDTNVFNAYYAAKHIERSEVAIVCEGPLDVLRLEEAGVKIGVAILGKKLHNGQLTALMNMGATKIILALDNDTAGKIGMTSAIKTARCLFDVEQVELPEHRNDLGEMTAGEIRSLFNEYATEDVWV